MSVHEPLQYPSAFPVPRGSRYSGNTSFGHWRLWTRCAVPAERTPFKCYFHLQYRRKAIYWTFWLEVCCNMKEDCSNHLSKTGQATATSLFLTKGFTWITTPLSLVCWNSDLSDLLKARIYMGKKKPASIKRGDLHHVSLHRVPWT